MLDCSKGSVYLRHLEITEIKQEEMPSNQSFMPLACVSKRETKAPKLSEMKSHCSTIRLCNCFHRLITWSSQASIRLLFRIIGTVGRNLSLVSLGFTKDCFYCLLVFRFTVLVQQFVIRYH